MPVRLERIVEKLPAPIRASLGRLRVGGTVGVQAKVTGRLPAPRTPPLRLPLELDARIGLSGISVNDPDRQLSIEKLGEWSA